MQPHPYRQIEIAKAIASVSHVFSIARRFAQQWGITKRAVFYMIAKTIRRMNAKTPAPKVKMPSEDESLVMMLMLRDAMKSGEPRGEIRVLLADAWAKMYRRSVDRLITRAIQANHEQIQSELRGARALLRAFRLSEKLSRARQAGDF